MTLLSVLAVGAGSLVFRSLFVASDRLRLPDPVRRLLPLAPPALVAAVVAPGVAGPGVDGPVVARLAAVLVAAVTAHRRGSFAWAVATGLPVHVLCVAVLT